MATSPTTVTSTSTEAGFSSRVQLALRVADLEGSIAFYTKLFGVEPAKRRPGYANFAVAEPPLKLVLLEGRPGEKTVMDHLGVEVASVEQVAEATARLSDAGVATAVEDDTACCYAVQDKVWVSGPGAEPWEVYVVKSHADTLARAEASVCCTPAADGADAEIAGERTPVTAHACC